MLLDLRTSRTPEALSSRLKGSTLAHHLTSATSSTHRTAQRALSQPQGFEGKEVTINSLPCASTFLHRTHSLRCKFHHPPTLKRCKFFQCMPFDSLYCNFTFSSPNIYQHNQRHSLMSELAFSHKHFGNNKNRQTMRCFLTFFSHFIVQFSQQTSTKCASSPIINS